MALTSEKERLTEENSRLNDEVTSMQEQLFMEKTNGEEQREQLRKVEKELGEAQQNLRHM